ncbi:MAG: phospholipase D-like domain-containing protein [Candidatus Omnitrophica bacterium]|nr:phospholipase D-like domain-containing protein [Candidatus Omnitrophota bacterium]
MASFWLSFTIIFCFNLSACFGFSSPTVYFTPRQPVDQLILKLVGEAREKVYLASYQLGWEPLIKLCESLKNRGVEIKVITEHIAPNCPKSLREVVRVDKKSSLFHAKFITVDNRWLVTGSFNLTNDSFYLHHNNVLFFSDSGLIDFFQRRFLAWWRDETTPFFYENFNVKAAFSPEVDCEALLANALGSAQKSIYFTQFQFTCQRLAEILIKKSFSGCQVFGIIEATATRYPSVFPFLFDLRVNVRRNLMAGLLHDKTFIIDGHQVITGSYNLTESARKNKECLLILEDEKLGSELLREWKKLWRWKSLPE